MQKGRMLQGHNVVANREDPKEAHGKMKLNVATGSVIKYMGPQSSI